jgi:hypothetical protein
LKDKRHGVGILLFDDGRFYKGMFANDLFKGKAIYKPAPGDASIILESTFDNGIVAAGPAKI